MASSNITMRRPRTSSPAPKERPAEYGATAEKENLHQAEYLRKDPKIVPKAGAEVASGPAKVASEAAPVKRSWRRCRMVAAACLVAAVAILAIQAPRPSPPTCSSITDCATDFRDGIMVRATAFATHVQGAAAFATQAPLREYTRNIASRMQGAAAFATQAPLREYALTIASRMKGAASFATQYTVNIVSRMQGFFYTVLCSERMSPLTGAFCDMEQPKETPVEKSEEKPKGKPVVEKFREEKKAAVPPSKEAKKKEEPVQKAAVPSSKEAKKEEGPVQKAAAPSTKKAKATLGDGRAKKP